LAAAERQRAPSAAYRRVQHGALYLPLARLLAAGPRRRV